MVQIGYKYIAIGIIFHSIGEYTQMIENKQIEWVMK